MEQTSGPVTEGGPDTPASAAAGQQSPPLEPALGVEERAVTTTQAPSDDIGEMIARLETAADETAADEPPVVGTAVPVAADAAKPLADETSAFPLSAAAAATPAVTVGWPPVAPYAVLWAGFAVATYLVLRGTPAPTALVDAPEYGYMVASGLTLVALAPTVALAVWLAARRLVSPEQRKGVFVATLARSAGVALLGVLAWWGALLALESTRVGGP